MYFIFLYLINSDILPMYEQKTKKQKKILQYLWFIANFLALFITFMKPLDSMFDNAIFRIIYNCSNNKIVPTSKLQ